TSCPVGKPSKALLPSGSFVPSTPCTVGLVATTQSVTCAGRIQSCLANSLLMSSYSAVRFAWSGSIRASSKSLLITESLNAAKLTKLSHAVGGALVQCHHTYWVSSSAPGLLRHNVAS